MRSSQIISLFSERPEVSQRSSSFVVSILAHGGAIGLLIFGIVYTPKIHTRDLAERYTVRHLDLQAPDMKKLRAAGSGVKYPGQSADEHQPDPGGSPAVLRLLAKAEHGPQTLLQPDITHPIQIKEKIPVPTVVIWAQKKTEVKLLVPPPPQKPTAADVPPMPDPPNQELNLADVRIASNNQTARTLAVLPSTTSPTPAPAPVKAQQPPVTTTAQSTAQPTPAAVMSLSDLQMKNGHASLPNVNESASIASQGSLAPGPVVNSSQSGNGNQASKANGAGSGHESGSSGKTSGATGNPNGGKAGGGQGTSSGSGSGDQPTTAHITLPADGKFGVVVVGASLEEKFPEVAKVWSGRLVYTVYLHVGLSSSWILQYSIAGGAEASAGGNIVHLDAPWPYNIVRPNIPPGAINADALMVRGFVNQAGRFEQLAVAFPPQFEETQFVLDALRQWQFRPAVQNGQAARVEVLLIIPEEP
jgi:hypothetical protein